jgi:hypothetical protein
MLENTEVKHRNCIIKATPTVQFPNLVTVIKTPKLRSFFQERRYVDVHKCVAHIELYESERLINSKETYVKAQLEEVVVLNEEPTFEDENSQTQD